MVFQRDSLPRPAFMFALVLAGAALVMPAEAQATASCSVAGTTASVYFTSLNEQLTISRAGSSAPYPIRVNGVVCANADAIDTIMVGNLAGTGGGSDYLYLTVDLTADYLAPGATSEAGGQPEVEVSADFAGAQGVLWIKGVGTWIGPNQMTAGSNGVDVNGDGDVDVSAVNQLRTFRIQTWDLNDEVSMAGGGATGSAMSVYDQGVSGGSGDDLLVGSPSKDGLRGEGGNDTLYASGGDDIFYGGTGDDVMFGEGGNDSLLGEDGDDELNGGGGVDQLWGSFGQDLLAGGLGNDNENGEGDADTFDQGATADGTDVFNGGQGFDTVTYAGRSASVSISFDAAANDGEAGEGDSINADIESAIGGIGSDTLVGNPAANTLRGGPGADLLQGLDGDDSLAGGSGGDFEDGGAGNDMFSQGTVADIGDVIDGGIGGGDLVDYSGRATEVSVTLDGVANDGESGEGDNVVAAESTLHPSRSLSVLLEGTGSGFVTSLPSGISCPSTCSQEFDLGASVDLSASANAGSVFLGWSGDCTGGGGCSLVLDEGRSVSATFGLKTYRPDGLVAKAKSGPWAGNGIYNSTGVNQAKKARISRGSSVSFYWEVQNDGSAPDRMRLVGGDSTRRFVVRYYRGTSDVTAQVTSGGYKLNLEAGSSVTLRIRVRARATTPTGSKISRLLTGRSTTDTSKLDTCKITATV